MGGDVSEHQLLHTLAASDRSGEGSGEMVLIRIVGDVALIAGLAEKKVSF